MTFLAARLPRGRTVGSTWIGAGTGLAAWADREDLGAGDAAGAWARGAPALDGWLAVTLAVPAGFLTAGLAADFTAVLTTAFLTEGDGRGVTDLLVADVAGLTALAGLADDGLTWVAALAAGLVVALAAGLTGDLAAALAGVFTAEGLAALAAGWASFLEVVDAWAVFLGVAAEEREAASER